MRASSVCAPRCPDTCSSMCAPRCVPGLCAPRRHAHADARALLDMGCTHLGGVHSLVRTPQCLDTCSLVRARGALLDCAHLGGAHVPRICVHSGYGMCSSGRHALLGALVCAPQRMSLCALLGMLLWVWAFGALVLVDCSFFRAYRTVSKIFKILLSRYSKFQIL